MALSRPLCTRLVAGILGFLLLLLPLAGCGAPGQAATPTPTPTSIPFVTIDPGIPSVALNSPIVGNVPDNAKLQVIITFKTNQKVLNQLQQKKIKAGQGTNLQQVANQLGISDETYAKIKAYFGIQDATLTLGQLHTKLTIDAKASTFALLLQTHFVYHKYNGRTFFAPATAPKLPKFIADTIVAITGLDNYSQPAQHDSTGLPDQALSHHARTQPGANCSPDPRLLTPGYIGHAYGYDQLWKQGWLGQNMTINLVEFQAFDPNDIQNYLTCVNFHGKIELATVGSAPTQLGAGPTLDLDMVAGLAPDAHIVMYQTGLNDNATYKDFWTSYDAMLQQIIYNNSSGKNAGSIVSLGYGSAENTLTKGEMMAIDSDLQILVKGEHMTVFASSGDCAAFADRVYNQLSVRFPASDPWTTSVGGTILALDRKGNRAAEIAWSDGSNKQTCTNQWGTGGGNSQIFTRPQWQKANGVNNSYSNGARQMPDLAAVAFAVPVYIQGKWLPARGTSISTPIWATGMLLVNQGLMLQTHYYVSGTQIFYLVADNNNGNLHPFYDITQGDNLYYKATPGWDFTSGLGTPNLPDFFLVLYKALKS